MSVFLAQQMRQYSLLFRIFTDFTLSTQKTEKSTVHFHTEFQVYKDALPKLEIMIYSALIPVPMAEARRHEIKVMESLFPNPCPYEK